MLELDPYRTWSLEHRLRMLAFDAELAHLPRSLIQAIWEAIDLSNQDILRQSSPRIELGL